MGVARPSSGRDQGRAGHRDAAGRDRRVRCRRPGSGDRRGPAGSLRVVTEVPPVDVGTPPASASGDADDPAPAPYPARWEADVVLTDGGTMHVRPMRPDDGPLVERFHERQSPESIYFRFFSPRPRLSTRDLERFTHVDYVDRMAFVGIIGDELVGIARYDRHRARSDAEVAFFIDDAHHGRGVATVLLEYLAVAARESGISGFTASVLPQNRKMLGVFTQAGLRRPTAGSRTASSRSSSASTRRPRPSPPSSDRAGAPRPGRSSACCGPARSRSIGASRERGHDRLPGVPPPGEPPASRGPCTRSTRGPTTCRACGPGESVLDVPGELDLAVICVPGRPGDAGRRGVRGAAGAGADRHLVGLRRQGRGRRAPENDLVTLARRHGMRLIGPNCLGVINTVPDGPAARHVRRRRSAAGPHRARPPSRARSAPPSSTQLGTWGLGISSFVAVGNKADVSGNDLLRYWQDDADTDVVLLYLESFGNPRQFSRIAREVSRDKPIVAVKVGRGVGRLGRAVGLAVGRLGRRLLDQSGIDPRRQPHPDVPHGRACSPARRCRPATASPC